ncbi:carboxypeptidase-like regulatory domain-containing protein [Chryseobacterium sp. A301]
MKKIYLFFILLVGCLLKAQFVSGTIVSKEDMQPISYAKIGIENQSVGTIADEKGQFQIQLKDLDPKTKLKIEVGGFEPYSTSIEQFLKEKQHTITLIEKVKNIEEVIIDPRKYSRKNWGISTKTKSLLIGHNPSKSSEDQSKEVAMLFRTHKKTKIEKININISDFETDRPVFIRYSVYDKNLKSILSEDLHDEITSEKIVDGTYSFDVSKNNIWVEDDFYVGIQLLSDFNGRFYMSGALMGNKTIYRNYLGEWKKVPLLTPAINIDVKIQK